MRNKLFYFVLLLLVAALGIGAASVAAGGGHDRVTICHQLGNGGWITLRVDDDAVSGHLQHGDFLVNRQHPCPPENTVTPSPEPTDEVTPEVTNEPTQEVTPSPEPTEEPTGEPTQEATPDLTAEPTQEVTPDITSEPTQEATPDFTSEPTGEVTSEPTTSPTAPAPNPPTVPQVVIITVTVWSQLPGEVGQFTVHWQVRTTGGGWADVVDPQSRAIVFTPIELRNRYNDVTDETEVNVVMSRLTLGATASTDPADYRALDAAGNIVGVWLQVGERWCNNVSQTCGTGHNHNGE